MNEFLNAYPALLCDCESMMRRSRVKSESNEQIAQTWVTAMRISEIKPIMLPFRLLYTCIAPRHLFRLSMKSRIASC